MVCEGGQMELCYPAGIKWSLLILHFEPTCPKHKQAETQLICQTRRGHESCPSSAHTSRTAVSLLPHGGFSRIRACPKEAAGVQLQVQGQISPAFPARRAH